MTAEALWELGCALAEVGSARRDLMNASFGLAADHQHALISCAYYAYQTGMKDYATGTVRADEQVRNSFELDSSTAEIVQMLRKNGSNLVFAFDRKSAGRIEATADMLEGLAARVPSVVDAYHMGHDVAEAIRTASEPGASEPPTDAEAIQAKMDDLWESLGGNNSFFTTDRTSCTGNAWVSHGKCNKCRLGDIVKQDWFKQFIQDYFCVADTNLSCSQFPKTYTTAGGGDWFGGENTWSCAGFAIFAEWFIFAQKDTDTVTTAFVGIYEMNYENLKKYARPGDLLRFSKGHSAILYEVRDTEIVVLDSNYTGKGNCAILKHVIEYDHWPEAVVAISRSEVSFQGYDALSIDPTYLTIPVGGSFGFNLGKAMTTTADHSELIWTSSDQSVATVSSGNVVGHSAGEVTISVATGSGASATVTINVVAPEYNCAEKWTCVSSKIGPRTDASSSAARAARYSGGHYTVKREDNDALYILAKKTDSSGNTWGFGAGYNKYLDQNIWGWFNLVDKSLGSEKFDFSYLPSAPALSVEKAMDGVARVSWTPADRATCYNLYQDGALIRVGTTQTTTDVAMEPGTTSSFMAEAVNEDFPYSHLWECKTQSAPVEFTMQGCKHPASEQVVVGAIAATCVVNGYTGDTYCNACGEMIQKGFYFGTETSVYGHVYTVDFEWDSNLGCVASATCKVCDESTERHFVTESCSVVWDDSEKGKLIVTAAATIDREYSESLSITGTVVDGTVTINLPEKFLSENLIIIAGYDSAGRVVSCKMVSAQNQTITEAIASGQVQVFFASREFTPLLPVLRIE